MDTGSLIILNLEMLLLIAFVPIEFCYCRNTITVIYKLNGYRILNKTLRVAHSKPPISSKKVNLYISGLTPTTDDLFQRTLVLRENDRRISQRDACTETSWYHVKSSISALWIRYCNESRNKEVRLFLIDLRPYRLK